MPSTDDRRSQQPDNSELPNPEATNHADSGFRAIDPTTKTPRRRRSAKAEIPTSGETAPAGADAPTVNQTPAPSRHSQTWRNADRAQRWQPLRQPDYTRLQFAQLFTVLAIPLLPFFLRYWLVGLQTVLSRSTPLSRILGFPSNQFPFAGPFAFLIDRLTNWNSIFPRGLMGLAHWLDVALICGLTFLATPYWLTWVLKQWYGMQDIGLSRLNQANPELQQRLQGVTQRQGGIQIGLLPVAAPIVFAYSTIAFGPMPRCRYLVISQGAIDQLAADEFATICTAEVSQMQPLVNGLLSWLVALLQIPYLIYWLIAGIGDRCLDWAAQQDNRALEILGTIAAYGLAAISSMSYSVFWLMRWPGLWLSRERLAIADHAACNATGNPNGQARALLKMAQGISQHLKQQGQTDYRLEGFELLMPVGYRQAVSLGSLLSLMPVESALAWDFSNSQRHWLIINNSHALIGDRLQNLMQIAQNWQLPTELDRQELPSAKHTTWGKVLWAGIPFWSALIGWGMAAVFWAIAWLAYWLNWQQLIWLGSDMKLFYALPLIGFGTGILLRFNSYFPDLPMLWRRQLPEPSIALADGLQDPLALPQNARPTALKGKLLGRRGISNWLGQDLWLQTDRGLVRLHHTSFLGPLSNWAMGRNRPCDLAGQSVTVMGWLRRGATPWFDLEGVRSQSGRFCRGGHQIAATVFATIGVLLGLLWLGAIDDLIDVIQRWQLQQKLQKLPSRR
jgi:Zn-dependent protease with chaperone function